MYGQKKKYKCEDVDDSEDILHCVYENANKKSFTLAPSTSWLLHNDNDMINYLFFFIFVVTGFEL